jgi:hypothetical protein
LDGEHCSGKRLSLIVEVQLKLTTSPLDVQFPLLHQLGNNDVRGGTTDGRDDHIPSASLLHDLHAKAPRFVLSFPDKHDYQAKIRRCFATQLGAKNTQQTENQLFNNYQYKTEAIKNAQKKQAPDTQNHQIPEANSQIISAHF